MHNINPSSGPVSKGGDMPFNPMDVLKGAPSFRGGPGGSAFSSSASTAIMNSPFVFGGGSTERIVGAVVPVFLVGVILWLVIKK